MEPQTNFLTDMNPTGMETAGMILQYTLPNFPKVLVEPRGLWMHFKWILSGAINYIA